VDTQTPKALDGYISILHYIESNFGSDHIKSIQQRNPNESFPLWSGLWGRAKKKKINA